MFFSYSFRFILLFSVLFSFVYICSFRICSVCSALLGFVYLAFFLISPIFSLSFDSVLFCLRMFFSNMCMFCSVPFFSV